MSTFRQTCLKLFGSEDLYTILDVEKDAKPNLIKKSYYKLSLKIHPDRVSTDQKEKATEKFQILGKIYSVLSDKEKRSVYDETGDIDDDDISSFDEDKDWTAYWRLVFPKITIDMIKNFEKEYKESSEEMEDLKKAYVQHEGDMDLIMECIMCATLDDEERFFGILNELIEGGELPDYPKFTQESKKKKMKRHKKLRKEAEEAEAEQKKRGMDNSNDDLKMMIQKRHEERANQANDFFAHLEAKYGNSKPKPKAGKRKMTADSSSKAGVSSPKSRRVSAAVQRKKKKH